uniref:Epsin-3 (Trinotate prediction) n=1 Tax=Myxobolus squamalis TaxID=59785 RepID=A0A6B2FXZ1_MYXSQ
MNVLWLRISSPNSTWRQVYKSLAVVIEMLKLGSHNVLLNVQSKVYILNEVYSRKYVDDDKKDRTNSIQQRVKDIRHLIQNQDALEEERKKAMAVRSKMDGTTSISNSQMKNTSNNWNSSVNRYQKGARNMFGVNSLAPNIKKESNSKLSMQDQYEALDTQPYLSQYHREHPNSLFGPRNTSPRILESTDCVQKVHSELKEGCNEEKGIPELIDFTSKRNSNPIDDLLGVFGPNSHEPDPVNLNKATDSYNPFCIPYVKNDSDEVFGSFMDIDNTLPNATQASVNKIETGLEDLFSTENIRIYSHQFNKELIQQQPCVSFNHSSLTPNLHTNVSLSRSDNTSKVQNSLQPNSVSLSSTQNPSKADVNSLISQNIDDLFRNFPISSGTQGNLSHKKPTASMNQSTSQFNFF